MLPEPTAAPDLQAFIAQDARCVTDARERLYLQRTRQERAAALLKAVLIPERLGLPRPPGVTLIGAPLDQGGWTGWYGADLGGAVVVVDGSSLLAVFGAEARPGILRVLAERPADLLREDAAACRPPGWTQVPPALAQAAGDAAERFLTLQRRWWWPVVVIARLLAQFLTSPAGTLMVPTVLTLALVAAGWQPRALVQFALVAVSLALGVRVVFGGGSAPLPSWREARWTPPRALVRALARRVQAEGEHLPEGLP